MARAIARTGTQSRMGYAHPDGTDWVQPDPAVFTLGGTRRSSSVAAAWPVGYADTERQSCRPHCT